MNRLAGSLAISVCMMMPAAAADLRMPVKAPPPVAVAVFNWTGCYVGADAGYLRSRGREFDPDGVTFTSRPSPSSGTFGGHVGCRYQVASSFVIGAEGDVAWLRGTDQDRYFTGAGGNTGNDGELGLRWNASARGILGFGVNRALFYGTGGASFINVRGCDRVPAAGPCFPGTDFGGTMSGWVAGGGIAYAFTDNLIGRVEYLHADYRSKNFSLPHSRSFKPPRSA